MFSAETERDRGKKWVKTHEWLQFPPTTITYNQNINEIKED